MKLRATLMHEWGKGTERYRLLSAGNYTAGYEDKYIVEWCMEDSLGGDMWTMLYTWESGDGQNQERAMSAMVDAIKALR